MGIIELATRRPVAITMLTIAVLLFGFVSLSRLEVTLLPNLSYPTLTIRTELAGAAPTEVETLLSKPIEEALGIIKNVRQVRSVSQAGRSDVTVEFNWGTKMDLAVLDVREKLDALELPKEAVRPIVLRFDPSQDPIVRLGLSLRHDEKHARSAKTDESDLKRLRRIAEQQVQKMLEGVQGVAAVKISGGLEDQVQVLVDLSRLSQLGLTLEQVNARLGAENANISGGRVDEGTVSYLVRTLNQFKSLDEIGETIVATRADRPIYVRDVAEVRAGYKEREAIIRIDGEETVEIALYKEGDSNAVAVAEAALRRAEAVQKALPGDLTLTTLYDQSIFIKQAISEVMHAAIEGGLLAILVLYLFLHNAWITAVVGVAIPISVIATFNVMYGAGASLNIMSLGGIALAIGLLVDDAIVVLENITRKHEQGLPLREATVIGAREVVAAVTASTLTTVAVFFPMVFVQGIAGQLFADQALVVTGSLIFSLIVSFTVTPMLVAREARVQPVPEGRPAVTRTQAMDSVASLSQRAPRLAPALERVARVRWLLGWIRHALFEVLIPLLLKPFLLAFALVSWGLGKVLKPAAVAWQSGYQRLETRYVHVLGWALENRGLVLGTCAVLFAFTLLLLTRIGVELLPPFNQGEFHTEITLAPGTPLERTDETLQRLSAIVRGDEALSANYSVAGTGNRLDASADIGGDNFGVLNLALKPEHYTSESRLMEKLRGALDGSPGLTYRFTRPTLFTLKTPLEIEVSGYDLDAIEHVSEQLRSRMLGSDRYTEVGTTLKPGHPELQIVFDQERAAALNLNTADLATRVSRAVQGSVATRYRLEDREIDVLVRAREQDRQNEAAVRNLIINPDALRPLALSAVATVDRRSGPSEIRRLDQQRVVVLSASLVHGDLGEAVEDLKGMIGQIAMPPGVAADVAGQSEEMQVSFRSLQLALALAVFLVYLVMASEFESLIHPFVILFTIPLAGIGAILALYLTGSVINVIALIGMIMLAGIVVKNGIVLIDLVNRLRDEGRGRRAALLEGGRSRLRPILMTTLTAVLGLLPMALGTGEGSEMRAPMAITVIGGLTISTLLTLVVIPVVYTLLDRTPDSEMSAEVAGEPVAEK